MVNVPEIFGSMVFNDTVMRKMLPTEVYESLTQTMEKGQTIDASIANVVASAMKDWAISLGATHYTHWFQPLTGATAEKHDSFISPVGGGKVVMEFSGKELIKGEPDASSFPSGGLRGTCNARGYTAWDPSSYAFVRENTLYIPTVFCSYTGEALDNKTPLLRSMDAISEQVLKLLSLLGDNSVTRVTTMVGAEKEYFLVNKKYFDERPDLINSGRTLFGAPAPKGQQLEEHYFGPLKPVVAKFMSRLDEELWKLGIMSKTKHNEVAPAQHELAPLYTSTNVAVDQNLIIMETMKKVAAELGVEVVLHEKPFEGLNGSGKHNNWSICTDTGENLLSPGKNPADNLRFLTFLAIVVKAVDDYQDLLRLSVASPANDHRLGADEAPPAIVSIFLGDELEQIVDSIVDNSEYIKKQAGKMNLGIKAVPQFRYDSTDRNRTSPFAFTGNKFEFRMLGSSQNICLPNVVLNTAVAKVCNDFCEFLDGSQDIEGDLRKLIKKTLTDHRRIIFNGDGYSEEWRKLAQQRGLLNLSTSVDVYPCLVAEKNIKLFGDFGIMNEIELRAREEIMFENYAKTIDIEARTMADMAHKLYIPATERYIRQLIENANLKKDLFGDELASLDVEIAQKLSSLNLDAYHAAENMTAAVRAATRQGTARDIALSYKDNVLPLMSELRRAVDGMETLVCADIWPVPDYGKLTCKQE